MTDAHPNAPQHASPHPQPHEPAPYRTAGWGWLVILVALGMIAGLLAIVLLNLDTAATSG